jgi:hypothetical protein
MVIVLTAGSAASDELNCPDNKTTEGKKIYTDLLSAASSKKDCKPALSAFRTLYLCLQKQLDYDGKKTLFDTQGKVVDNSSSVPLPPGTLSNGQLFEKVVFAEFQNALKKVAILYQEASQKTDNSQLHNQNTKLLAFLETLSNLKASGKNSDPYKKFLDDLLKKSETKFGKNDTKALNAGDIYLIKNLMIHAQDKICSINSYNKKGGRGTTLFSADELKKVKESPINKLMTALKASASIATPITLDENLTDEDKTIKAAVNEAYDNIKNFYNTNINCLKNKKTGALAPSFIDTIQGNIQSCNYRHFIETLGNKHATNIEGILHFINANQQLIAPDSKKTWDKQLADTYINEPKVDEIIRKITDPKADEKKTKCNDNPDSSITLDNEADTKKFKCKMSGTAPEITGEECAKLITISADKKKISRISNQADSLESLSIDDADSSCQGKLKKGTPPVPPTPEPVVPACTEETKKCCDEKNVKWHDEPENKILPPNAKKYEFKDSKCSLITKKDDPAAPPDATAADAPAPNLGVPTPSKLIQPPPQPNPFTLRGEF